MPNVDIPQGMDTGGSPRRQETTGATPAQTKSERVLEQPNEPPLSKGYTSGSGEGRMEQPFELTDTIPPTPYDSPLTGGYTPGSDEGRLKLLELMNTCTTLSNRVITLENELLSTKDVYHKAFITKKLETYLKQKRSRVVIHSSDEEEPTQKLHDEELAKETARQEQEDMCTYLKNQGGYKQSYFKGMKYEDIRPIFERVWDQIHTFVPKDSKIEKEVIKRSGFSLQQESSKKQKLDEQTDKEVEAQADIDQEIKDMKLYVKIVPDEDITIDDIPLATKPLVIVKYKIFKEGKISTYHIIRADGSIKRYTLMIKLLENIDREDLKTLWKLVKDKHGNTRPEEDYERVL
nr:hypothetical protein [Tanacetum cinerariifolium]